MKFFLKLTLPLSFLLIASNPCMASAPDEWVEHTLDSGHSDGGEKAFSQMRDKYFTADHGLVQNVYFEATPEQIGEQEYAYITKFYGESLPLPSIPEVSYPKSGEGEAVEAKSVGYLSAPPLEGEHQGSEVILSEGGKKDNRTLIENVNSWPYRITCHLKMKVGNDDYMGTGFLVGPAHILTAGHNYYNWRDGIGRVDTIDVFPLHYVKEGEVEKPIAELQQKNPYTAKVWKVYIKKAFDEQQANSLGKDMALFVLDKPIGCDLGWGGMMALNPIFFANSTVNIHGYPRDSTKWEKPSKFKGRMYGMEGALSDHTDDGIIYHKIDTTGGQSGSGMWMRQLSPALSPFRLSHIFPDHYTVGVHTGGGRVGKGMSQSIYVDNRRVYLQNQDIDFILTIIKSHLLPSYLVNYINSDAILQKGKIDTFIDSLQEKIKAKHQEIRKVPNDQELGKQAVELYKKFILYNVAFNQTAGNNPKYCAQKHLDYYCDKIFLEAFANLKDNLQNSHNDINEAIFFLLMRKKIVVNEDATTSISTLDRSKTTLFLKKLKTSHENIYRQIKFTNGGVLYLSITHIRDIVTKYLRLNGDNFNLDDSSIRELNLFTKTMNTSFGYKTLLLGGFGFNEPIKVNEFDKVITE